MTDYLYILIESLIVGIPFILFIEWQDKRKEQGKRDHATWEKLLFITLFTAVSMFILYTFFHNRTFMGTTYKSPIHQ